MVLYRGRGELATVTAAHTVAAHANLRESGPALGAAARACDSVLRLLDSGEANPAAYNLLCRYLALLDGDEPPSGRSPAVPGSTAPPVMPRRSPSGSSWRWRPASRPSWLVRALRRG